MAAHSPIITIDVSPALGELAEILSDVGVETISLQNGWGSRTFQTTSNIHVIHIQSVWAP